MPRLLRRRSMVSLWVDKAKKSTDIEHLTAKKQDEEQALATKKSDLEDIQKELDAALIYFYKLKLSCADADVSCEDRVAWKEEVGSTDDDLAATKAQLAEAKAPTPSDEELSENHWTCVR